jgi:energy-coupling factor transport system ATP-binding protein
VLATHDLHTTRTWAGRVIVMDGGRVVADGPTQHIFRDPATLERTSLNVVMGNLEQA